MRRALLDFIKALPWVTIGTALWIAIAYKFHQSMIDAVTGGEEVTRQEAPQLYNLLENLCISRGITMPKLKIIDDDALNAFATGMNEKQYSITVTRGLIERLNDAEIESVLGHELTHIRNGDVRMLVVAVVIAGRGVVLCRAGVPAVLPGRFGFRRSSRSEQATARAGAGIAIIIAIALIVVAWVLSIVIRFALSRRREFLADAGSVELTKNPDAMISALRKIEGRGELPGATSAVMEMCVDNPRDGFHQPVRHPSLDRSARRRDGEIRRRPRSRPDRTSGAGRRPAADRGAVGHHSVGARPVEPSRRRTIKRCRHCIRRYWNRGFQTISAGASPD